MEEVKLLDSGRYRVLQVLHRGGFGAVYDAIDTRTGERVAVKILTLSDTHRDVAEEMVKREVGALEGFEHPAVARLLRHFDERAHGRMGIVLELVPGTTNLEQLVARVASGREEPPALGWCLRQLAQLLDALDRAHQRRIVHRDVKPSNILLDRDQDTLKLADFGVALVLEQFGRGTQGRTLREFYSRPYAAPEQTLGQEATVASDLHAFGVVAACLLASRLPGEDFRTDALRTFFAPAAAHIPDASLFSKLSETLVALVAPDPNLRPKAAEVGRILREAIERTTARPVVSLRLSQSARTKAVNTGLRDPKAIQNDLNADLRVQYQTERDAQGVETGFTLRLWGRTLCARAKPIHEDANQLVLVDAIANPPTQHHRQREDQLVAPFTLAFGSVPTDASAMIQLAYADHQARRRAKEAEALEESVFALSETVLEHERERLQEVVLRYEAVAEEPRPAMNVEPLGRAASPPADYQTRTGQLLALRILAVKATSAGRDQAQDVTADWFAELRVDDDRFYYQNREVGLFYAFNDETKVLTVRVQKPSGISRSGILELKDLGTERSLDRQESALTVFKRGGGVNPSLRRLLLFPEDNHLAERRPLELFQPLEPRESMRDIVERAVAADDFFLVQGPPGTGKTTFIAEVMAQIIRARPGDRILLTSQANEAVDNAIEALRELAAGADLDWRIVRYYGSAKDEEGLGFGVAFRAWTSQVKERSTRALLDLEASAAPVDLELVRAALAKWQSKLPVYEDVREDFASTVQVFGLTCIKVPRLSMLLSDLQFDRVIVDEAAKATPTEVLVPLNLGRRFIMVGDHRQLPPYLDQVTDEELRARGLDAQRARVSLFEALFDGMPSTNKATLFRQFRMHRSIGTFVSDLYYPDINGGLGLEHGAPDDVRQLALPDFGTGDRVFWLDVPGRERQVEGDKSWWNQEEVDVIGALLEKFEGSLVTTSRAAGWDLRYSCAVIAAYATQRQRLHDRIVPGAKKWRHLELVDQLGRSQVATVDAFQGRQRDIVVYSMVRTSDRGARWVSDPRRLNVAFSRARRLLVVVGSREAAARTPGLEQVLRRVSASNVLNVEDVL